MSPDIDILVVSYARDRATIERFLQDYVDRAASHDRGDEELMMLPVGAREEPVGSNFWEWEPARNLNHIVQRGLDEPPRAFYVYLKTLDKSLSGATLGFTTDGRVIFGLSINEGGAKPENTARAILFVHKLAAAYGGERGWIGVEMLPPLIADEKPRGIVEYELAAPTSSKLLGGWRN